MKELVVWAHSECRSNAALFAEIKRLAESRDVKVAMCLWDEMPVSGGRKMRGLEYERIGDDLEKGRAVLSAHGGKGSVHVFCVYQNSAVWRRLILEAKLGGAKVVVNAEAPCEMCVGVKAVLKRAYYRFVLPWKVGRVARCADVFLNASGTKGTGRLVRLGWARERIVPFGYASAADGTFAERTGGRGAPLRVLHTGGEAPYRDVATLEKAVGILKDRGIPVELRRTGGMTPANELARLYDWADVLVACGICEPWGMRVNDAIHAGLPVAVSDGMGAKWLVELFGCGCVFGRRDAKGLADILERMSNDGGFMARLRSGAKAAHEAWTPQARAKVWLEAVERA